MAIKILIVEDDEHLQALFAAGLGRQGFEVLQATTIEMARLLFFENADIAAVVMDGCVPGNALNTVPLVGEFRSLGFRGPMIATSADEGHREAMRDAGCDHECRKHNLVKVFPRIVRRARGGQDGATP